MEPSAKGSLVLGSVVSVRRQRDRGHVSAEALAARLFDSGIYHQLDYAKRLEKVQSREQLVRQSKLIATITGTLLDFLRLEVKIESDRLEIH